MTQLHLYYSTNSANCRKDREREKYLDSQTDRYQRYEKVCGCVLHQHQHHYLPSSISYTPLLCFRKGGEREEGGHKSISQSVVEGGKQKQVEVREIVLTMCAGRHVDRSGLVTHLALFTQCILPCCCSRSTIIGLVLILVAFSTPYLTNHDMLETRQDVFVPST